MNENECRKPVFITTELHEVTDIKVGRVQTGESYNARDLVVETKEGHRYQLTLFGNTEDDLTVKFSG